MTIHFVASASSVLENYCKEMIICEIIANRHIYVIRMTSKLQFDFE